MLPVMIPNYPFLIVAANSHETVWYRVASMESAEEVAREKLEPIKPPEKQLSGKPTPPGPTLRNGGSLDPNRKWEEEARRHLKMTLRKTLAVWAQEKYSSIVVAAPEELRGLIHNIFTTIPTTRVYTFVPGNFTNSPLKQKLLEQTHAALFPSA